MADSWSHVPGESKKANFREHVALKADSYNHSVTRFQQFDNICLSKQSA